VLGNVVATAKHPVYHGQTLLVVQPIAPTGQDTGSSFLAVDRVQAGPGDRVLVMSEGNGVRQILQMGAQVPIRSLIVGVVDRVDGDGGAGADEGGAS
jgi:ethanolamine utilization protein EutN